MLMLFFFFFLLLLLLSVVPDSVALCSKFVAEEADGEEGRAVRWWTKDGKELKLLAETSLVIAADDWGDSKAGEVFPALLTLLLLLPTTADWRIALATAMALALAASVSLEKVEEGGGEEESCLVGVESEPGDETVEWGAVET